MKIEIWSDFACPFCYIGKRKLEKALNQNPTIKNVEIIFRSFELAPDLPRDGNVDTVTMLANKYGMSLEQAKADLEHVEKMAAEVGLEYHLQSAVQTNTFDAHRLVHYAATKGKSLEMAERLFQAYFTENQHIGHHNVLEQLAEELGLDRQEVHTILVSDDFSKEVRADEQEAAELGVRGVPFFVFNRKYAISGAQPVELFAQVLQKVWDEEQPLTVIGDESQVCTDEGCIIPNTKKD